VTARSTAFYANKVLREVDDAFNVMQVSQSEELDYDQFEELMVYLCFVSESLMRREDLL